MAFGQPQVDFNYFLARKYALLQQQADAGSEQARAATSNAATGATVGAAAAGLDRTRASLMPAESAAAIALQRAQGGLIGAQTTTENTLRPLRVDELRAGSGLTRAQTTSIDQLNELQAPTIGGALQGALGARGYTGPGLVGQTTPSGMFRFSTATPSETRPRRLPGETQADYMDRTGWGL